MKMVRNAVTLAEGTAFVIVKEIKEEAM